MGKVVEFRNGDASCIYDDVKKYYTLIVTKCGEMGRYKFNKKSDVSKFLKDNYYFTNDMVKELFV